MLGTYTFAEIQIEPETPRWGQEMVIRVTPEFPRDKLYPGDQVFVILETLHQGLSLIVTEESTWDGQAFVSRLTLPGNCELARFYVRTPEKVIKSMKSVLPRTEADEFPPGAKVVDWHTMGKDRSAWMEIVESELVLIRKVEFLGIG